MSKTNRRSFLKVAGAIAGGLATVGAAKATEQPVQQVVLSKVPPTKRRTPLRKVTEPKFTLDIPGGEVRIQGFERVRGELHAVE